MDKTETTCRRCYWSDDCDHEQPCEYYYIPGIEDCDELLQCLIERRREEYHRVWQEYVSEFE